MVDAANELRAWHGAPPLRAATKDSGAGALNGYPWGATHAGGNLGRAAVRGWYIERFLAGWKWDRRGQIDQNPWARVGHHGAAVVYDQAASLYCWIGNAASSGVEMPPGFEHLADEL